MGTLLLVSAKHTQSFNPIDPLLVDRIQRNFEPIRRQVQAQAQAQPALPVQEARLRPVRFEGKNLVTVGIEGVVSSFTP